MLRATLGLAALLAACSGQVSTAQTGGQAPITGERQSATQPFVATPVATFDAPWAMSFLPDGRVLVTESGGKLKLISADGKSIDDVLGLPTVDSAGQGGLMDVVVHPDFANNSMVYLSWSESGPGGKGVALGRGMLIATAKACPGCPVSYRLTNGRGGMVDTIFRASPFVLGNGHYAGRIAFSPDSEFLFFSTGERQKFTPAQDKGGTLGKMLRLTPDGKAAPDNPLVKDGFLPEVWSYGHRNPLGIAFDAEGRLWEQEMGPRGGDEVNLILPGKNYGYPIVSNGDHYDGRDIPDHATRPEFEAPKVSWNPVISPGGLLFYTGKMFSAWQGNLLIGGLSSQALVRVKITGDTAEEAERYDMGARIRDVEQGPDGAIWVLEDEGRLLKLTPKP